jgi:hypothetical protein
MKTNVMVLNYLGHLKPEMSSLTVSKGEVYILYISIPDLFPQYFLN